LVGGAFEASERMMTSAEELDPYLAGFVSRELAARPALRRRRPRLRLRRDGG
jgi:hypothetical protein